MHPAPSVILFTTLSGAGFGLLFWLGLGLPAPTGWAAFGYFVLAYLLAVGGLIASTLHLGHPERAWRAFSQWRSSWLSREGVSAVAALLVMAVYGAGLVFFRHADCPAGADRGRAVAVHRADDGDDLHPVENRAALAPTGARHPCS